MLTRRFYRLLSRGWWLRLCPNQSTKIQQAKSRETRQPHQAETRRLHRVETSRADPGISRVDLVVSRGHRAGIGRADLGMGGGGVEVVDITPDGLLSAEWVGQDVRVTFVDGSSEGEVLAVPVSAVSQRGDGATVVTVV